MATFLFDDIVFGPVKSRRLGNSLGINLLPDDAKVCTFNCVYCECGWTNNVSSGLPSGKEIKQRMDVEFKRLHENHVPVDVITFAGNGEPTLHPEFDTIIDHTIKLRDGFFPDAEIAVLTNATLLHKQDVNEALQKVEKPLLKLDSAIESTVKAMNQPQMPFDFQQYLEHIRNFPGKRIIQTMFVRFQKNGEIVDNTTEHELKAWLRELDNINPDAVLIYSIARDTPDTTVTSVSKEELKKIAARVEYNGHKAQVF
jgi:wyosine [tRNA(Phe)-imidazoG37] synthetase (radical SAM superfamily)